MPKVVQGEFTFRNVGQGLFYTGIIRDFRFVYDCGSDNGVGIVKDAINEYKLALGKKKSDTDICLDLLILSHFDRDHVNGVTELLQSFKVHTVVIPYLYPIERLKVASKNLDETDDYYNLLKDPVTYFQNYNVKQIVFITGEKKDNFELSKTDEPEPINTINDSPFGYDLIREFEQLPDSKVEAQIKRIENLEHLSNDIKISIKKRGSIKLGFNWEFTFFTYDCTPEVIKFFFEISNIEGKNPLVKDELLEILASKNRRKIKQRYNEIIKKYKPSSNISDINNTSIVLNHMPIRNIWCRTESMLVRKRQETEVMPRLKTSMSRKRNRTIRLYKSFRESGYFKWYLESCNSGTLLFGDIDVRKDLLQINSFFGNRLHQLSTVSIPHHGSANNWDIKLFSLINNLPFQLNDQSIWVASCGFGNKYGHPDPEIVDQLIQQHSKYKLFINNEMMEVHIIKTVVWN